jgi:hypothetical protein
MTLKEWLIRLFSDIQPEFSRLMRFFYSAKILDGSDTGISDIDQSLSSIFAE